MFIDVMEDFSRKLGERVARQSAGGLAAAQQERREAMKAYDRARRRQQLLTGGVAVGALIGLGIASLVPPAAPPVDAQSDVAAQAVAPPAVVDAPVEPAPPVMVAAAQPTLLPATTPAGPTPEPPSSNVAAPIVVPEPLAGEEVREVQKRLRAFGFNPGPVDGVAGPMTANAVASYRHSRGQQQTGDIDRDLLDQLRQDSSPQVAQAPSPQRTAQRARTQRPAHRETPLDQFGRWLRSLVR